MTPTERRVAAELAPTLAAKHGPEAVMKMLIRQVLGIRAELKSIAEQRALAAELDADEQHQRDLQRDQDEGYQVFPGAKPADQNTRETKGEKPRGRKGSDRS